MPLPLCEPIWAACITDVALRVVQPLPCCSALEHLGAGGSIHLAEPWPFSSDSPPHQSIETTGCRERSRLKDSWTRTKHQDRDTDATYPGCLSLQTTWSKSRGWLWAPKVAKQVCKISGSECIHHNSFVVLLVWNREAVNKTRMDWTD